MQELDSTSVESSELVEQTFKFWFNDNDHIRSPFPSYIHTDLRPNATSRFFEWVKGLNPKAKDELNDEAVGEKFEELIFEEALKLIKTEDERITILYPFLPRIGDMLNDPKEGEESSITDREIFKDGDTSLLKIKCVTKNTGNHWETSFELPM